MFLMKSLENVINYQLEFVKHFADKSYVVCENCGKECGTTIDADGDKVYDLEKPCECGCKKYMAIPRIENHAYVVKVLSELAEAYRAEIHEYLVPSNIANKEQLIRNHIKTMLTLVKPIIDSRISVLTKRRDKCNAKRDYESANELDKILNKYKAINDDFTALIAFRHFETFCLYIDGRFNNTIFHPSLHLFKGFYFYANSMVLNKDVHFIEKQCFAGAGKSATDCALMAWILGYDINSVIIKVFGNINNVPRTMNTVIQIMTSAQYAKVFPYYAKFEGKESAMFRVDKPAGGDLAIQGSYQPLSLTVTSKGESIDGTRMQYLFLDDITQAKDANNVEMHRKDKFMFTNSWFERKDNLNNTFIIASGTTYHQEDLLSYLKEIFGVEYAKPTKFKFTSLSTQNELIPSWKSVFIVIYGLDENDKSTFEEKFPTEIFLFKRKEDYRMFMAMVQQQPLPPEGSPFDYDNLPNLYGEEGIPHLPDRSQECCRASLDPSRKGGKDFNSMPVIVDINGELYLKDVLFEQCPPDKVPLKVVDMIERHRITQLDIEKNTDTLYANIITKMLRERGITWCKVTDFYTVKKKESKIGECETAIKSIHFPQRGLFTPNSQMGKFMYWLTAYNYEKPPKHDDSVDSLANFALKFIINNNHRKAKVLDRRKR